MGSTFGGLNIGLTALVADQVAMDTSAHNTANANTDGYTRQRVELQAAPAYPAPAFNRSGTPGQIGTGVSIAAIQRIRDAFVDQQIRQENPVLGQWTTLQDQLGRVETVFPEPSSTGLGAALSQFWGAWQDLAASPTSTAAKAAVVEQGGNLASALNSTSSQLSSLVAGIDYQVGQQVDQVNELATQLASLNQQIKQVAVSGDNPNDLMDQRDLLLDKLSSLVPITVQAQSDGTDTVLAGGVNLVTENQAREMTTTTDANGHLVPSWQSGQPVALGDSALGALVTLRDTTIPGYMRALDGLVSTLVNAVNGVYGTAGGSSGGTPPAFFVSTAGAGVAPMAATIAVSSDLVANPDTLATGTAGPGDNSIAGAIADLQNARTLFGAGTDQTIGDAYAGLVGRVGSDSQQATTMAGNEQLIVQHLTDQRESESGVSLDEEATDMIRFQRGYEAASRVITAMDQMLDQLINRTGAAGL